MPSRNVWLASALAAALAAPAASEVNRRVVGDFHRRATVDAAVTAETAYAVPLSSEAVAALKSGGELRVFDGAGREVPSLVYSAASHNEVVDRPAAIFNRAWIAETLQ